MNTPTNLVHLVEGVEYPCKGDGCQFCACGSQPRKAKTVPAAAAIPAPVVVEVEPAAAPVEVEPTAPALSVENPNVFPQLEMADGLMHVVGGNHGLTLRDVFAAAALSGVLAGRPAYTTATHQTIAAAVWRLADAMLAARTAEGGAR